MSSFIRSVPRGKWPCYPKSYFLSVKSSFLSVGFTLLELMIVMGIIFTLAGIMVPSYVRMMDRARITMAIADIKTIEKQIAAFKFEYDRLPDSLDQINCEGMNDPWGNPYVYMSFAAAGKGGDDKVRKDHSLHPLNSSYDLCSMGKDGASVAPLTAEVSRDDIIRANDGGYVGLASEY